MIKIELPYDFGTFVKVKDKNREIEYCGIVAAYTVVDDGYLVWVSGYKQAVTGEFLPEDIELMSEEEIEELKKRYEF